MNASHYVLRASTYLAAALVFVSTPVVAQGEPTSLLIDPYPNKVQMPDERVLQSVQQNANKAEMRAVKSVRRSRPAVSEVSPRMVTNMDTGVSADVVSEASSAAEQTVKTPIDDVLERSAQPSVPQPRALPVVEKRTTRDILNSVVHDGGGSFKSPSARASGQAPLQPSISLGAGNIASPAYKHEQAVAAVKQGDAQAVRANADADLPPILRAEDRPEPVVSQVRQVTAPLLPSRAVPPAKTTFYSNAEELGVSLGHVTVKPTKAPVVNVAQPLSSSAVPASSVPSSNLPSLSDDRALIHAQAPRFEEEPVTSTEMIPVSRLVPTDRRYGEHIVPIEERNVLMPGHKIVTKVEQAEPVLRSENLPQAQAQMQPLQSVQPQPVLRENYARRVIDTMTDSQSEKIVNLPPQPTFATPAKAPEILMVPKMLSASDSSARGAVASSASKAEPAPAVQSVLRMKPVIDDAVIVPGKPRPIERVDLMPSLPSLSDDVPAPALSREVAVSAVPAVAAGGDPEPILFDVDTGAENDEFALQRSDLDRQFSVRREWKSLQGYDLREVLYAWSQQAGVTLVWDTGAHFSTLEPLRVQSTYTKAVQELLDQYGKSARRPHGKIYSDPRTGERYLVVSAR